MSNTDLIWDELRKEVIQMTESEPLLSSYLHSTILNHDSLMEALSYLLAEKLAGPYISALSLQELITEAFNESSCFQKAVYRDLTAISDRDPAAQGYAEPFLHFKGFHAIEAYRVAHWLWFNNRRPLSLYFQNRISEVFAVDIHPAAKIGSGIFIDHGTSVVIGETAVVEDDVSMLHEVTLGGTGKDTGDRHPKVGKGVLIGAGAKILGNVTIGEGAKVGAGSVVLVDVPPHTTVAGVPARIVGHPRTNIPAFIMNQSLEGDSETEYKKTNNEDISH